MTGIPSHWALFDLPLQRGITPGRHPAPELSALTVSFSIEPSQSRQFLHCNGKLFPFGFFDDLLGGQVKNATCVRLFNSFDYSQDENAMPLRKLDVWRRVKPRSVAAFNP